MSQSNEDPYVYASDPRVPCKYGVKCYQKNPIHNEKYKHPPGRKETGSKHVTKKFKVETKKKIITQYEESGSDSDERRKNLNITSKEKISIRNDVSESNETDSDVSHSEVKECIQKNDDNDIRQVQDGNTTIKGVDEDSYAISGKTFISNEELGDCTDIFKMIDDSDIENIKKYKDFLRDNFLINMPTNFFNFWNFCKKLKSSNPQEALKDIGLILVGPFDVLAGKFDNNKKSTSECLIHWRYFRDPPEFQTVLKGDDKFGYHIGYFRDLPDDVPAFLCSNQSTKDGVLTPMGGNIFAAVNFYLEDLKKSGDPFKKMHIGRIQTALKKEAGALRMDMSKKTNEMVAREKKIVARSFNKIGLVVPFDKKTEVGYRELALSNKDLNTLLTKLQNAKSDEEKSKFLSELQPVFTFAIIATDECDFGTGIELGWNLLAHGIDFLNSTIKDFLVTGYRLVNREAFAKIAECHMENRRKGCNLSTL